MGRAIFSAIRITCIIIRAVTAAYQQIEIIHSINIFSREDCIELLENCLDWRRISPDLSVRLLCSRFDYVSSENSNASCISVKKFLQPIKNADKIITNQLTIPCRDNVCDSQDVCLIDRNCFATRHQKCSIFQCVEGKYMYIFSNRNFKSFTVPSLL